MNISIKNSDYLGVISSLVCLAHCILTPLLFLSQATIVSHEVPMIWQLLNYIFITLSFIAVYFSSKKTTKIFIKMGFWINWSLLFLCILNESIEAFSVPELFMYIFAASLCLLHIYSLKYCNCEDQNCCV